MEKGKPGVMVYWETFEALDRLKPEKLKTMLKAMRNFAQYGEVPDFSDDDMLEFAWPLIEQKLVADSERYSDIVNKKRRAIYGRWWKRYAKENGLDENDEEAKEAWIDMRMQEDTPVYTSNTNNTDVSPVIQNIPTTTTSSSTTTTSSTTTARATETTTGSKQPSPAPLTLGRFNNVLLSEKELADLKAEFPEKWGLMIESFSAKLKGNNYQYTNHYAKMVEWELKDAQKEADKPKPRLDWGNATERSYEGDQVPW